jgi:uncharacterized protein
MKNHPGSARSHGRETRVSATPQRFEIRKNSDGSRSINGTAVVFNSLSEDLGGFKERIAPGAFTQSLKDNPDVIIAYQHDLSQPLGRVSSGTAKVWQDSRGLQFSCTLPETTYASNLIALMERGDVSQMSFGFAVPPGGDEWTLQPDGTPLRTVNTANLFECSVVTTPAYSATSVNLRSAPSYIRTKIKARRAADQKTKTVDGEALTADCFIIVGNADDPETWHLPWKFSTEEKTKAHLRDALARFDQLKGISADVLKTAWNKLVKLCKEHGIDVSSGDRSLRTSAQDAPSETDITDEFRCDCRCAACSHGACNRCTRSDCQEQCSAQHQGPSKFGARSQRDQDIDDLDEYEDETGDDDDFDDLDECRCSCRECRNGDCDECSNAYCEDDDCTDCAQQERSRLFDMVLRRLR